jgi:hypothetical protein
MPLNPSALISLSGSMLKKGIPLSLKIYSPRGQLVKDLSSEVSPNVRSVNFSTHGLASGVYLLRCEAGNRVVTKRMTLLK